MIDENKLKTCQIQGDLFVLATKEGLKSSEFIRKYMKSETAQVVDELDEDPYCYSHEPKSTPGAVLGISPEELFKRLLAEEKISKASAPGELYSEEIMYWAGWLYRYWHYSDRCKSSIKIWRKANGQTMKKYYDQLHKLSPEEAVEKLYEISMHDLWMKK